MLYPVGQPQHQTKPHPDIIHFCDAYGCHRVATRFLGSRRIGWLRFCQKHADVALTLHRYLRAHGATR